MENLQENAHQLTHEIAFNLENGNTDKAKELLNDLDILLHDLIGKNEMHNKAILIEKQFVELKESYEELLTQRNELREAVSKHLLEILRLTSVVEKESAEVFRLNRVIENGGQPLNDEIIKLNQ